MRNFLRSWWRSALRRRRGSLPLRLERLEGRIVFALPATPLPFTAFETAHAAAFLATPEDFQLYRVHLGAGDVVNVAVSSQASGGALQSSLRVFDATGHPLALDAQQGGDPRLTFQAPAAGDYLVGVSSAGDEAYDPAAAAAVAAVVLDEVRGLAHGDEHQEGPQAVAVLQVREAALLQLVRTYDR